MEWQIVTDSGAVVGVLIYEESEEEEEIVYERAIKELP